MSQPFRNGLLGSSTGVQLGEQLLASGLVRRTHELRSAAEAVRELLDLLRTNCSESRLTLVLAGIQVESAVEISPGMMLHPFDELQPPPWHKDLKEQRNWPISRDFEPIGPSAAPVTTVGFEPVFSEVKQVPERYAERDVVRLRMMANCIALAVGGPLAMLPLWCEDNDPRLPVQAGGVTFHDPSGPGMAMRCIADVDRIRAVISDYLNFRGNREPIEMGMARLTSARGSWKRESRAIDLGIALESLLLFEKQNGGREPSTEIRYRLGLRAAWLTGKDVCRTRESF